MGITPADLPAARGSGPDPLARLDEIDDVPLAEQVELFDAIHTHLSARLKAAES